MKLRQPNPRRQGDIGESLAAGWFIRSGYRLWIPFGHSHAADLVVEDAGRRLLRVQVKTSTVFRRDRWKVRIGTRGGSRIWRGIVKRLDQARYDLLFVVVADGRAWCIPSTDVDAGSCIRLGGPKYARFEVDLNISMGEAGFEPA